MPDPSDDVLRAALQALPEVLRESTARAWGDYLERARGAGVDDSQILSVLPKVWACSEFVARACIAEPELLVDLAASGDLLRAYRETEYANRVEAALASVADEAALAEVLRAQRRREMVRIAWRDLAGWADLHRTTADLTALAGACIEGALARLYGWQCRDLGTPTSPSGSVQSLVVLGMGKLGAGELNFSSDIDLLFAYPDDGETRGASRQLANSEFFLRLGQKLIKALGAVTPAGLVFRVDMRLRPYGEAGPLAMSFEAMERYYQSQGREWERYALIKARVVAGDRQAGARLLAMLRPFVYRRYLDFGALESLREMKDLISQEVRRKGLEGNVKLGAGGIREVEFIAQSFQLTRGGRETALQDPRLLPVLEWLRRRGYLPDFAARELTLAYVFLRDLEHRLQEFADQQTQTLPHDEVARARLALGMGRPQWSALERDLLRHTTRVHEHFQRVFAAPQAEAHEGDGDGDLRALWQGLLEPDQARAVIERLGMEEPTEVLRLIEQLREARAVRSLSTRGRERLDRVMPLLLRAAAATERPNTTLPRLLSVIEAIGRRTAYLALLVENPLALSQLVKLCAASPWIASQIARHPLLLDDLIDPRALYAPPDRDALADNLRQTLLRLPEDDLDAHMESLRHFQQTNALRVAAADVTGVLPLMVVSDHLTDLAEVVLQEVLELAWRHLVAKHGRPPCADGRPCDKGFAIVAYGKLAGIELGYGSDLDLVFLHSGAVEANTDGMQPVAAGVFFARLAQRIIHILTTHTPAGRLYDVDLRLRPSGASGLLVTTLEAFGNYQRNEAWTWEHQALVRSRTVAGDPEVASGFQEIRDEVLARERDPQRLKAEVREMRNRMRAELGSRQGDVFDLKQDPGGIADIEFIVQYGVLRWSHEFPALLEWTDNIRLLDTLQRCALMAATDAALLQGAYRRMRAAVHRCTLQGDPPRLAADAFPEDRAGVLRLWQAWLED